MLNPPNENSEAEEKNGNHFISHDKKSLLETSNNEQHPEQNKIIEEQAQNSEKINESFDSHEVSDAWEATETPSAKKRHRKAEILKQLHGTIPPKSEIPLDIINIEEEDKIDNATKQKEISRGLDGFENYLVKKKEKRKKFRPKSLGGKKILELSKVEIPEFESGRKSKKVMSKIELPHQTKTIAFYKSSNQNVDFGNHNTIAKVETIIENYRTQKNSLIIMNDPNSMQQTVPKLTNEVSRYHQLNTKSQLKNDEDMKLCCLSKFELVVLCIGMGIIIIALTIALTVISFKTKC